MAGVWEKEKNKLVQDRCQVILSTLLKDEDNKYCVDCDAKSPRWASWNLGIFLCIRCAGIHRNLGVHISKVKSVNLDSWTPQQVASIEHMGNSRARAVYEANLPDNFRRPHSDSSLEQFVRAKYEAKKYIAKEWVPSAPPTPTWDIEIEKQLKKKKDKKPAVGKIELPATTKTLSKNNTVSPKPLPKAPTKANVSPGLDKNRRANGNTSEGNKSSALDDLLGLESSNSTKDTKDADPFGDFLSAPVKTQLSDSAEEVVTSEFTDESSFFNQVQPDPATNEKLSKDSILALYSKAPVHNPPPQMFGNVYVADTHSGTASTNLQSNLMQQTGSKIGQPLGAPMQNPPLYQQPNASLPVGQPQYFGNSSPMVPTGYPLSAANPFAQVHTQFAAMNVSGGVGVAPYVKNSQFQNGSSVPLNSTPSNNVLNNFWQ